MDAQNRTPGSPQGVPPTPGAGQSAGGQRDKFPEPRAWALKWETLNGDEMADRASGRFDADHEPQSGDIRWDKFPQPRGWALRWDGNSIGALPDTFNSDALPKTPEPGQDES